MRKLLLFLVLVSFAGLPSAQADTVYTSSAAFFAAISGLSQFTEDYGSGFFDGEAIPNGFSAHGITYTHFNLTSGATQGDITNLYNSFTGLSLGADHTDLGPDFTYFLGSEGATITFDQPVTAFGMFFNVNLNTGQYGFIYPGGQALTDSATYDTDTFVFVGVVADNPFTTITFSSTDATNGVFNVPAMIYATGANVPEPSSILLLCSSAFLAVGSLRSHIRR
jgi:hypothetical protein